MADDRAVVRIPQITDMPAAEAYAFLMHQFTTCTQYRVKAERARLQGNIEREAQMRQRGMLVYKQICKDIYTLTIGAPVWETQP